MYPVLFSLGPIHLYSLSVFLVAGWLVFSFLFWKLLRSQGVEEEKIFDLTFYSTLAAFVSARLLFVFLHFSQFADDFLRVAAIWVLPGLSLYGGIIGAMLALIALSRSYKVRVGYVLDAIAIALPAALLFGLVGSFLDGAEIGRNVTALPWAVRYVGHEGLRHPIQAYEFVGVLIMLIILTFLQRRAAKARWPYGLLGVLFFLMFSLVMFGLEFFKESTVYWKLLSANQWILVAFWCEALGAFYVRGGGREALRPFVYKLWRRVTQAIGGVYAKFSKRDTR